MAGPQYKSCSSSRTIQSNGVRSCHIKESVTTSRSAHVRSERVVLIYGGSSGEAAAAIVDAVSDIARVSPTVALCFYIVRVLHDILAVRARSHDATPCSSAVVVGEHVNSASWAGGVGYGDIGVGLDIPVLSKLGEPIKTKIS